jgi:hypothetical protein
MILDINKNDNRYIFKSCIHYQIKKWGKDMKSKIIGILVCMMLLTTFLTVAMNDDNVELKKISHTEKITSSFDDDVPTWTVGDMWTYKIDDINIDIEDNKSIHGHMQIDELILEVVGDAGDLYDLYLEPAKINGDYSVYIEQENSTIDVEGQLLGTKIEGHIFFTKSDLGIKEIDVELSGILTIKINELPEGLPFSNIPFPVPVPATIEANLDFGNPYVPIDFPLNTSKMWGISATNFSLNGEVRSIWFNIIKFIDQIATAFGSPLLPPEIAELLPDIDIKDALEMRGMSNIFEIPEIPSIFSCFNMENITVPTVPPETFNAYNISIAGGLGRIYYVPELKNIIKISGQLGDLIPFIDDIDMELIDYNLV